LGYGFVGLLECCLTKDVGIFLNDDAMHMQTIHEVLTQLRDNGFTANSLKYEWAMHETADQFSYWLAPNGLKPWSKQTQGIGKI
jgi:nucleoside diphosphate kinase